MKASILTLTDIKGYIPRVMLNRYNDTFLQFMANEVLADIEQECDPDYFRDETPLILQQYIQDYAFPDSVRHVRGLYSVPAGWVIPDRSYEWPVQIVGSKIRINRNFVFSDTLDIDGNVWFVGSDGLWSSLTQIYDGTVGRLDATNLVDNQLKGRLLTLNHLSGPAINTTEYRILLGNTIAADTATVAFPFASPALADDSYSITANFLIIDHVRYLTRFTGLSSVLPLSQDFEKLFRCGVTYKYHHQADELSNEAKDWGVTYQNELDRFRIDTNKPRGMVPRNEPRGMPNIHHDYSWGYRGPLPLVPFTP